MRVGGILIMINQSLVRKQLIYTKHSPERKMTHVNNYFLLKIKFRWIWWFRLAAKLYNWIKIFRVIELESVARVLQRLARVMSNCHRGTGGRLRSQLKSGQLTDENRCRRRIRFEPINPSIIIVIIAIQASE